MRTFLEPANELILYLGLSLRPLPWLLRLRRLLEPGPWRHGANVGMKLIQRRGRWANIKPTLNQRIMFVGDAAAIVNTLCMHTRDITTMSGY